MSNEASTSINRTHRIESSSYLRLDDTDMLCPVCKQIFVFPRTYQCGHTVCELCMKEMDIRAVSEDTHTAIIFKCPVCRNSTLKSWDKRPISVLLEKIVSNHPDYKERRKEVLKVRDNYTTLSIIPEEIDLAQISKGTRFKLAIEMYEIIVEKLYKAALIGKSYLIIKNKQIVSEIEKIVDILSFQLFNKNNIYKILITRNECTIYLTKRAFRLRRDYINSSWVDPLTGITQNDNHPPPHVSILSTLYNLSPSTPSSPRSAPPGLPPESQRTN